MDRHPPIVTDEALEKLAEDLPPLVEEFHRHAAKDFALRNVAKFGARMRDRLWQERQDRLAEKVLSTDDWHKDADHAKLECGCEWDREEGWKVECDRHKDL